MSRLSDLVASGTVTFNRWNDPLAANGLRADSDDALFYLTPFLGPSSTLLLHRLGRFLNEPGITTRAIDTNDLAISLGYSSCQHARFRRTVERLELFGMLRPAGTHIEVRTLVPKLAHRHVARMPTYLQQACPYKA